MILVQKIKCNLINENCYVVYDNASLDAIIIDPGLNYDDIVAFVKNNSLNVKAILLTHGHFDHTMSCNKLQKNGYKVYISKDDAYMCDSAEFNFAKDNNIDFPNYTPDYLINDENELNLGTIYVKILKTPGHSKGGLSYVIGDNLFTGDTLFEHGYGRTDLNGGNFRDILSSIKKLRTLVKQGYKLYCGHDY